MTVQIFQIGHFSQLWETVLHNLALASLNSLNSSGHTVLFFAFTKHFLPSWKYAHSRLNVYYNLSPKKFSWQAPTCDCLLLFVTCFHIQMFKQTYRHYQSFRFMISITTFCPFWVGTIQFSWVFELWHFLIILRPRACSVNTLSQILPPAMESVSCLFFLIFFLYAIKVFWYARVRNIKVHTVSPKT